jgi:hypothetical protein
MLVDGRLVSLYNVHISMQFGRDMGAVFERRQQQFAALEQDLLPAIRIRS